MLNTSGTNCNCRPCESRAVKCLYKTWHWKFKRVLVYNKFQGRPRNYSFYQTPVHPFPGTQICLCTQRTANINIIIKEQKISSTSTNRDVQQEIIFAIRSHYQRCKIYRATDPIQMNSSGFHISSGEFVRNSEAKAPRTYPYCALIRGLDMSRVGDGDPLRNPAAIIDVCRYSPPDPIKLHRLSQIPQTMAPFWPTFYTIYL